QTQGYGHHHGDDRDQGCAEDESPDPEPAGLGLPDGSGEEVGETHPVVLEEEQRLLPQLVDDAHGDGDREGATYEQEPPDGEFAGTGTAPEPVRLGYVDGSGVGHLTPRWVGEPAGDSGLPKVGPTITSRQPPRCCWPLLAGLRREQGSTRPHLSRR